MNHRGKNGRNHEYQDSNDSASTPETCVHSNSASLIDNIFVNNPELISGSLVTDSSNHFLQIFILTSTRDKIIRKQSKKRDLSYSNLDSINSDLATNLRSGLFFKSGCGEERETVAWTQAT